MTATSRADTSVPQPTRVVMIVANSCVNDTRVLKEAASLRAVGWHVTVVCDNEHGRLGDTTSDDVPLRRLDLSIRGALGARQQALLARLRRAVAVRRRVVPPHSAPLMAPSAPRFLAGADHALLALLRYGAITRAVGPLIASLRPHVVHAHDLETLPAAARAAHACGARLVYDAHELEQHRLEVGPLARLVIAAIERHYIRRADSVITVCASIATKLSHDYGITRPSVIMNCPDLELRRTAGPRLREKLALAPSVPLAVYVGRVARYRGLEQTVQALVQCPDLHFACVGTVDPEVAARLRELARRDAVETRLHIEPPVAPFEVLDFISSADFAVIPTQDVCLNYRLSLPNKLFDSTFAGLPLCAADLPEQRAFVAEAANGVLMNAADPSAIARAMTATYARRFELRPDPRRLQELAQKYAWRAQSAKLLALYGALAPQSLLVA